MQNFAKIFRVRYWGRTHLYISIAFLLLIVLHWVTQETWEEHPLILYWPQVDNDISCHMSTKDDALPSIENFSPKGKSIYFHETSCRGGLNSRQACAVESAARAHPGWDVYLLFNSPVSAAILKKSCLVKLLKIPNVKIARIHANSFSMNSVVHSIVINQLKRSLHPVEHSADIMKMLTLNRWGGVSLDLDMIVLNPFDALPYDWIAKESPTTLSTGAMAFSRNDVGRNVTTEILKEINKTFDIQGWSTNGVLSIQRVLMRRCPKMFTPRKEFDCNGFTVYGYPSFYPLTFGAALSLFDEGPMLKLNLKPYTLHAWNILTRGNIVHPRSPYAKLAQMYCPITYKVYGKAFGV